MKTQIISVIFLAIFSYKIYGKLWGFDTEKIRQNLFKETVENLCENSCEEKNINILKSVFLENITNIDISSIPINITNIEISFNKAFEKIRFQLKNNLTNKRCAENLVYSIFIEKPYFNISSIQQMFNILSYNRLMARTLPRLEDFKNMKFTLKKSEIDWALTKAMLIPEYGEVAQERFRRFKEDLKLNYPGEFKLQDSIRFFFFLSDPQVLLETLAQQNCSIRVKPLANFTEAIIRNIGYIHLSNEIHEFYNSARQNIQDPLDLTELSTQYINCLNKMK